MNPGRLFQNRQGRTCIRFRFCIFRLAAIRSASEQLARRVWVWTCDFTFNGGDGPRFE